MERLFGSARADARQRQDDHGTRLRQTTTAPPHLRSTATTLGGRRTSPSAPRKFANLAAHGNRARTDGRSWAAWAPGHREVLLRAGLPLGDRRVSPIRERGTGRGGKAMPMGLTASQCRTEARGGSGSPFSPLRALTSPRRRWRVAAFVALATTSSSEPTVLAVRSGPTRGHGTATNAGSDPSQRGVLGGRRTKLRGPRTPSLASRLHTQNAAGHPQRSPAKDAL
jgi:hypothetical protein